MYGQMKPTERDQDERTIVLIERSRDATNNTMASGIELLNAAPTARDDGDNESAVVVGRATEHMDEYLGRLNELRVALDGVLDESPEGAQFNDLWLSKVAPRLQAVMHDQPVVTDDLVDMEERFESTDHEEWVSDLRYLNTKNSVNVSDLVAMGFYLANREV